MSCMRSGTCGEMSAPANRGRLRWPCFHLEGLASGESMNPLLYQVNTRVLLFERGVEIGRPATLDDLPDAFLDDVAARGFDWVWMLGVWQTGEAARAVSASNAAWLTDYRVALPDFTPQDVTGSPFAIVDYGVHRDFGGDE